VAGLGAAAELRRAGYAVEVLEAEAEVGGLARSFTRGGFRLEFGPHFVRSTLAETAGVCDRCVPVSAAEAIHYAGGLRAHPFGLLARPELVASVLRARAWLLGRSEPPTSLRDALRRQLGAGFAAAIAEPLLEKWAGEEAGALAPEAVGRLDPPELAVLLHHLWVTLTGRSRQLPRHGGAAWLYPTAGIGHVASSLAARAGLTPQLGARVEHIAVAGGRVAAVVAGGREWPADLVVASLPRGQVLQTIGAAPATPALLEPRAVLFLGFAVARARASRFHWTWFPGREWTFYRVGELKNAWAEAAPRHATLLQAEVACDVGDERWADPEGLARRVWPEVAAAYGLHDRELVGVETLRAPVAHPVVRERERAAWHELQPSPLSNLYLAGRFGVNRQWLMHEAYDSGVALARRAAREHAAP
ncbi:MAG: FAD-dependent oxidoreductase, partial [Deltaproteobacteria bacterium]|nr:FAD-dependent oxidoreductase [Deltaproteobacteria bacterium]